MLLITAAELHTRADLDLVDAAESSLSPQVLAVAAAAARGQQPAADGGIQQADSGTERAADAKRRPA
jgi:hypothetical protein